MLLAFHSEVSFRQSGHRKKTAPVNPASSSTTFVKENRSSKLENLLQTEQGEQPQYGCSPYICCNQFHSHFVSFLPHSQLITSGLLCLSCFLWLFILFTNHPNRFAYIYYASWASFASFMPVRGGYHVPPEVFENYTRGIVQYLPPPCLAFSPLPRKKQGKNSTVP